MVSSSDESRCTIVVEDEMSAVFQRFTIFLKPSSSMQDLFNAVTKHSGHNPDSFQLQRSCTGDLIKRDDDVTVGCLSQINEQNVAVVKVVPLKSTPPPPSIVISLASLANKAEEAGESTPADDHSKPKRTRNFNVNRNRHESYVRKPQIATSNVGYVGLVNQAMTCYLNSLLQALYMTPEFRNSLYKWEFVGTQEEMSESIPYQLQKLFVSLQTSSRSAVETSKLTKSFGWDASDSWQQHDIQELCRVMFDALEQKFKDTDQADFINNLYQGKLIDYVTCLECKTEKKREDTFLDIPLPVRPFGSTVAYNSVAEAMHAFVQPETLDGNNQYFCESCNKKCDAHKGLKFSHFPYILTLHFKRFDFDYGAMTRIKLTDRVEFPHILNINGYLSKAPNENTCSSLNEESKGDDASFTDSVLTGDEEVCLGVETVQEFASGSNSSGSNIDIQDEDEGIDVVNGTSNQLENEKNRQHSEGCGPPGPYVYELFAIMIHSGSASGGHYYVYIKDFDKGEWFCFDDQTVCKITHEDILMTYGGGSHRGYYSGAHSSSTNAYMLMYRQIDKKRNQAAVSVDEFPPHLKELMQKMQEEEEEERVLRERDRDRLKIKVFFNMPDGSRQSKMKLVIDGDTTLAQATATAYDLFALDGVVPLEQCRLVSYDSTDKTMDLSFDGQEEVSMNEIYSTIQSNLANSLFLEVRDADQQFEPYRPGGVSIKVYRINTKTSEVENPVEFRTQLSTTVGEIRSKLGKAVKLGSNIKIMMVDPTEMEGPIEITDNQTLEGAGFCSTPKIFVAEVPEIESTVDLAKQMSEIIDKFCNTITLYCSLPELDHEVLVNSSLPDSDREIFSKVNSTNSQRRNVVNGDCEVPIDAASSKRGTSRGTSPQMPPLEGEEECLGATVCSDQSTSEDSSLADSDRTIVGDEADYFLAELSSASNSPPRSDQPCISSSEEKDTTPVAPREKEERMDGDCPSEEELVGGNKYLKQNMKIEPYISPNFKNAIRIQADKRCTMQSLRASLALHMGVHADFIKIFRKCQSNEIPWSGLSDPLSILRNEEHLVVRLERALRKDEYRGKVYMLLLSNDEPVYFHKDWIISKDMLIGEVKKQILDDFNKDSEAFDRCRLRLKKWKTPGKILLDCQSVEEVGLTSNWELFLQELNEPESVTTVTQVTVLLKRFSSRNRLIKDFHEITLESPSFDELRERLHELSGIPLDSLEFARPVGTFPYLQSFTSNLKKDLEWDSSCPCILDDSTTLFYRDKNDEDINNLREHRGIRYKHSSARDRIEANISPARGKFYTGVSIKDSEKDPSEARRLKDGKALKILVNSSSNSGKHTNH